MEEKELDKAAAFDTLFTTNHIQMCKVLLSYLPVSYQGTLAVYIKLAELNYTLSFLKRHPHAYIGSFSAFQAASDNVGSIIPLNSTASWNGTASDRLGNSVSLDSENLARLMDDISPYLSYAQRSRFQQMKNMMQSMKNLQEMMEMAEMMKSLFPEGMGGFGDSGSGNAGSQGNPEGNSSFSGADFFSILSNMGNMSGTGLDPSLLAQAMQMMNPKETAADAEMEPESESQNE